MIKYRMSPKFGLEASASVIFSLFYFIFCIGRPTIMNVKDNLY